MIPLNKGKILFEGNSRDITLTDNYTNYDKLVIEANYYGKVLQVLIKPVDGARFSFTSGHYDSWYYLGFSNYVLSNKNKITADRYYALNGSAGLTNAYNENKISITKVIAYKKKGA